MTNLYYLQKTPKLSTELAAIGTADNLCRRMAKNEHRNTFSNKYHLL